MVEAEGSYLITVCSLIMKLFLSLVIVDDVASFMQCCCSASLRKRSTTHQWAYRPDWLVVSADNRRSADLTG